MRRLAYMHSLLIVSAVIGCTAVPGEDLSTSVTLERHGDVVVLDPLVDVPVPGDDCTDPGGCPTNSPVIATFPFHELSVKPMLPNAEGFTVTRFLIQENDHELRVEAGQIRGRRGADIVTGRELAGAQLWLRRGTTEYVLRIRSVVRASMWARLDPDRAAPEIEAYVLDWTGVVAGQPANRWRNICAAATLPVGASDALGAPSDATFIFEGERIDPTAKVITGIDRDWFNLGCAGHLLAKMYLMGHVEAASSLGYFTTLEQRQTLMKMFAADYCGTGTSFTVPGIRLQWQDDNLWARYPGPLADLEVEARWTPTGATCLNVPRVMANPSSDSIAKWPDGVVPAIAAQCPALLGVPCHPDIQDTDGAHLVTANP
jgi:hypothetical protein